MISSPVRMSLRCIIVFYVLAGCKTIPGKAAAQQLPTPTLAGIVSYDDGAPANGALIAITSRETGGQVDVLTTDNDGRFQSAIAPGDYAVAVTGERGFAWIESEGVPNITLHIKLSQACHSLTGQVDGSAESTRVTLSRRSTSKGDTFVGSVRKDGRFELCLPEAHYRASLTGRALSLGANVNVPEASTLHLKGFSSDEVKRPPAKLDRVPADLGGLVADISASDPVVIGLGEATHGTSEFFSARGALTLELIRRAGVRLILFEFDAIAGAALDGYVNGTDVDIAKAVAALGFWTTDTYEFLRFLDDVRRYNATATDKVHVWGIDLQNTVLPVDVLVNNAAVLSITDEEQATLKLIAPQKGKPVRDLSVTQRRSLNALLARLETPRGASQQDLIVAVAARSLTMQMGYWDGDMISMFSQRRDAGMASLAGFIVAQLGAKRACLWAHAGHVSKESTTPRMGHHLASIPTLRYYGIGFYMHHGSARAWDANLKIGVISHPFPPAPAYTVESVVMASAGTPEIAWVPFHRLPTSLRKWMETPRFVREVGAIYTDNDDTMTLRSVPSAFDAVVVIQVGHDSSPTPTGDRKAKP